MIFDMGAIPLIQKIQVATELMGAAAKAMNAYSDSGEVDDAQMEILFKRFLDASELVNNLSDELEGLRIDK